MRRAAILSLTLLASITVGLALAARPPRPRPMPPVLRFRAMKPTPDISGSDPVAAWFHPPMVSLDPGIFLLYEPDIDPRILSLRDPKIDVQIYAVPLPEVVTASPSQGR